MSATLRNWVEHPGYTVTVSGRAISKTTAELTLTSAEVLGSVATFTVMATYTSWGSLHLLWPDGGTYALSQGSSANVAAIDAASESCGS